jgi:hypothetical protein
MPAIYAPPAFRNRNLAKPTPLPSTKKTALKKEFAEAFNSSAFPSLGDTIQKKSIGTPISFSSAAAKKIVAPKSVKAEVPPGWVHIRKHQGKIEYKYGAPVPNKRDEVNEDFIMSKILFKYQLARGQYERDRDIEHLGDLSEFYGQPTLAEIYANDVTLEEVDEDHGGNTTASDYENN